MTHEELTTILQQMADCTYRMGAYHRAKSSEILAHDQAQRAVIEQQAKEIEQWKTAAQQQNGWYEPLQRDNKTLREALQAICRRAPIMGSTGEYLTGQLDALEAVRQQAQQALKGVS